MPGTTLGYVRSVGHFERSWRHAVLAFGRPRLSRFVSEGPAAARALVVEALDQRRESGRLRKSSNGLERKWSPVSVMAVGDPAYGMPKDLDR